MNKKILVSILAVVILAFVHPVEAQQPKKVPRIGFLGSDSPSALSARVEAFRQGLRELGYIEGQNITIEYRYAEGVDERLPNLAEELVHLKVDVIVTNSLAAFAAANASKTIPIVITEVADPVESGLVASLAHPGGNVTGLSAVGSQLGGKRLELLKEAISRVSRVAILLDAANPNNRLQLRDTKVAAEALRVTLQPLEVRGADDFEPAFSAIKRERASALIVLGNPVNRTHRTQIMDFAVKNRLPVMYMGSEETDAGGLMSYGPNRFDFYRRAATYVDKILKGAKPADLPVEQPTKFEFIIN